MIEGMLNPPQLITYLPRVSSLESNFLRASNADIALSEIDTLRRCAGWGVTPAARLV
jgi:hypothetical protein